METSYRVSTDYIFDNSFVRGFHGGADDGPGHPDPGQPWWKLHGKWYKPATSGPSAEETIIEESADYLDKVEQEYGDTAMDLLEPYLTKIQNILYSI